MTRAADDHGLHGAVDMTGLEADALEVALSRLELLGSLREEDLGLWLEVALLLDEHNVRAPALLLGPLADFLRPLEDYPEVRPLVHRTIRTLFDHFPRLVIGYLHAVEAGLNDPVDAEASLRAVSDGALRLASDPGLAQPYLEQAPAVLAAQGVEFLRFWQEEAFLVAESDWWAARGFLAAGGRVAAYLMPTDLAPLGELGARIAARSRHGAKAFFRSFPTLRRVMPMHSIRRWVDRALVRYSREEDLVLYLSCPVRRAPGAYFIVGE